MHISSNNCKAPLVPGLSAQHRNNRYINHFNGSGLMIIMTPFSVLWISVFAMWTSAFCLTSPETWTQIHRDPNVPCPAADLLWKLDLISITTKLVGGRTKSSWSLLVVWTCVSDSDSVSDSYLLARSHRKTFCRFPNLSLTICLFRCFWWTQRCSCVVRF